MPRPVHESDYELWARTGKLDLAFGMDSGALKEAGDGLIELYELAFRNNGLTSNYAPEERSQASYKPGAAHQHRLMSLERKNHFDVALASVGVNFRQLVVEMVCMGRCWKEMSGRYLGGSIQAEESRKLLVRMQLCNGLHDLFPSIKKWRNADN